MPDGIESFCKSQSIHFAKYHFLKVPLTQGYQAQNEMIFNIVVALQIFDQGPFYNNCAEAGPNNKCM